MKRMDEEVLSYLITGGKELNKKDFDKHYFIFDLHDFVGELINRVEDEDGRKLTGKQRVQVLKLVVGVMKRNGWFDERFHLYLIGKLIKGWW